MKMPTHRPTSSCATPRLTRGFTLLELLVAMFIAAVIFAMGYGAINQGVKSRIELQEQQAKLLELQSAMRVIEQDFVQLAPRPVRQPVGNDYYPALMTSSTTMSANATQPIVALTRAGWSNPAGLRRPALQRVAYYFDKGTLVRDYYPVLDATQSSKPVRRELLTHLKAVGIRFYSQGQNWGTQWPLSQRPDDYESRPIAVEITFETENWGKIVRLIELPG
jgi:general secretion pathway protein J